MEATLTMQFLSSPSGTLFPIISVSNLSKVQFPCPYPPMLSLAPKFFGIGCDLSGLNRNLWTFVFKYSRVKYFSWIICANAKSQLKRHNTLQQIMQYVMCFSQSTITWNTNIGQIFPLHSIVHIVLMLLIHSPRVSMKISSCSRVCKFFNKGYRTLS